MVLFPAVIISKTSSKLAHIWITGLEHYCSIFFPSLWKTFRFNLPPSLRFSRLRCAHQPAALHELLFTLWRSHRMFHREMEQTGDKMSTAYLSSLLYKTHNTVHMLYVGFLHVCAPVNTPMFVFHQVRGRAPRGLHSKYCQG